jgi:alkylation response protein AidB-like acyl-CoA dehydrogenase
LDIADIFKEMDFTWSERQLALKSKVIDFANRELNEDIIRRDVNGEFSKSLWQKCSDYGILNLASDLDGNKISFLDLVITMEGFGYACLDNGLALGLGAQMLSIQMPIQEIGTAYQKEAFLKPLANGTMIGAHGLTEPDSGSDVYNLKSTAKKVKGGYILNGQKCYVTLAPISDVAIIFASTNPKLKTMGISAFLVNTDTKGFTKNTVQDKMGLKTVPIGEYEFKDCFVPEENRIGKEGVGLSISQHYLKYERCAIMASQVGTMERQLEECIAFSKNRKQYNQSINNFQSVSNRLANMKLRLETSRLLLYKVAWLIENKQFSTLDAAMLKLHLSESFYESSLDAIRIHGAKGYLSEFGVERNLRDAAGGLIYAGTSDIQRNLIARLLE